MSSISVDQIQVQLKNTTIIPPPTIPPEPEQDSTDKLLTAILILLILSSLVQFLLVLYKSYEVHKNKNSIKKIDQQQNTLQGEDLEKQRETSIAGFIPKNKKKFGSQIRLKDDQQGIYGCTTQNSILNETGVENTGIGSTRTMMSPKSSKKFIRFSINSEIKIQQNENQKEKDNENEQKETQQLEQNQQQQYQEQVVENEPEEEQEVNGCTEIQNPKEMNTEPRPEKSQQLFRFNSQNEVNGVQNLDQRLEMEKEEQKETNDIDNDVDGLYLMEFEPEEDSPVGKKNSIVFEKEENLEQEKQNLSKKEENEEQKAQDQKQDKMKKLQAKFGPYMQNRRKDRKFSLQQSALVRQQSRSSVFVAPPTSEEEKGPTNFIRKNRKLQTYAGNDLKSPEKKRVHRSRLSTLLTQTGINLVQQNYDIQ